MINPHLRPVTAVSAVEAVRRSDAPAAPRELRGTDPLAGGYPRPDAAGLSPIDIARFEALVFEGSSGERVVETAKSPMGQGSGASAIAFGEALAPMPAMTPADRIASTLRHLPTVRGL